VLVADQPTKFLLGIASLERGLVLHHLGRDVVDGHRINGDGHTGINQFAGGIASLSFEGDLAESVIGPVPVVSVSR
jgi:hypothetical protein